MCGIIGIVGKQDVVPRLLKSLRQLEYRGYDSAGLAVLDSNGVIGVRRAAGKLIELNKVIENNLIYGFTGIGHTRWATHGPATVENAHPHYVGKIAIVHNGIIENYRALGEELSRQGRTPQTSTDTEVIAHLFDLELQRTNNYKIAFYKTLQKLKGAFAICAVVENEVNLLLGARRGSPLAIGIGKNEMFLGSDALALVPHSNEIIYLEDDDYCVLTKSTYEIFDGDDRPRNRHPTNVMSTGLSAEKGTYRHFMLKEIYEQPETTLRTVNTYLNQLTGAITLPTEFDNGIDLSSITSIQMIACGTAFYACTMAQYWIEEYARISVRIDIASEFRYRKPVLDKTGLIVVVSQSGETADTLAALQYCQSQGLNSIGIVNVMTSSIARLTSTTLESPAGIEIGVASTKAFTSQLCTLAAFSIALGRAKNCIDSETEKNLTNALNSVPRLIADSFSQTEQIKGVAYSLSKSRDVLFVGRGTSYPIALEGALKLKEISYIHAEGYPAGELKHGPIALVNDNTPVVFVAPFDRWFAKSLSNLEEVASRHGKVILISDQNGFENIDNQLFAKICMPTCHSFVAPIISTIPVQLLAYYTAVEKGTDVDQPRNLAKSVTVE